jgi:hypothetical protein
VPKPAAGLSLQREKVLPGLHAEPWVGRPHEGEDPVLDALGVMPWRGGGGGGCLALIQVQSDFPIKGVFGLGGNAGFHFFRGSSPWGFGEQSVCRGTGNVPQSPSGAQAKSRLSPLWP